MPAPAIRPSGDQLVVLLGEYRLSDVPAERAEYPMNCRHGEHREDEPQPA